MTLFENPINPESAYKFKIVVDAPDASFEREFKTLKALRQFLRRNPEITATPYVLHNDRWERFVIVGSQILPKSSLNQLLETL
jgi:hypothetical protein